jgi:saccharopine dehydrogenase-like NADP-dependent oxidoreductase
MKKILILGAGQSAPYLIAYMLEKARQYNWFITVGDLNLDLARSRINDHPQGTAIALNANDADMLSNQIRQTDMVVNLLAPRFQHQVAWDCVVHGKHMISVSYRDRRLRDLDSDAHRKGIMLLTEMGLDPGMDHMSAVSMIQKVHERKGRIRSFESYGTGLPAPDSPTNPLKYIISWNPRNVVMAGENGAQYIRNGHIKIVPYHSLFQHSWPIEIDGLGNMEAYPNRDSLVYKDLLGFEDAHTLIRGTIRYPGWSETWQQIVRLGLPNERLSIPNLPNMSYAEMLDIFLPHNVSGSTLQQRVANYLNISPTGKIMENLSWLGLFSDEIIGGNAENASEAMIQLISRKLSFRENSRDMVLLHHKLEAEYPEEKDQREIMTSTMIHYGEPDGFTAMAKSVGLPAAIAAKLILNEEMPITGCHIPTHPAIYTPILKELAEHGFIFKEKTIKIPAQD